jgi:phosphoribosylformylglycinamidine synthase
VAESVRNLACTGARAAALSDCLNFGNPEKPEIMWEFVRAIEGMAAACEVFETPVISGNVSFYNDTLGASVPPTPVVAMVGIAADARRIARTGFARAGQLVVLLGGGRPELVGSEYLSHRHGLRGNRPPAIDLVAERATSRACVRIIEDGLSRTAHDVSDGGIAIALAEMTLEGEGIGCRVDLSIRDRLDTTLFGESGCRILLALDPKSLAAAEIIATAEDVPLVVLGETGGDRLVIRLVRAGDVLAGVDLTLAALRERREATLPLIAAGKYGRSLKAA